MNLSNLSAIQDQAQLSSSNRLEMTSKNVHKGQMAPIEIVVLSFIWSLLSYAFSKATFCFGNKCKEKKNVK